MRVTLCAFLICVLLQACGSKGALVLPPDSQQQSDSNKRR